MMSKVGDAGRRLKDACLSGSVAELEALIKEDELILSQVSSLTGFFINGTTPLHVAASFGHLDFAKALLAWKPNMATELDSARCSPLHLACTEGHFEIMEELLRVKSNVCLGRDEDGRIPLHLAAIKGRVEVIPALLRAKPESIHEKLDRGETVLHLCVKYNMVEALKTLVQYLQKNDKESLLSSKDNDGNTILHLAAALKQMDTIKYLLEIKIVKDDANVKNRKGFTALDFVEHCPNRDLKTMEILEFLFQAGLRRPACGGSNPKPKSLPDNPPSTPSDWRHKAGQVLQSIYPFWIKYFKVNHTWLQEVRGHLITAATLTATMAYQAILSPPGGFRQESQSSNWNQTMSLHAGLEEKSGGTGQDAGTAVLDSTTSYLTVYFNFTDINGSTYYPWYLSSYRNPLADYMLVNTLVLIGSLCTIMLALSGFPANNKFLMWQLIFTVYITIFCMSNGYFLAMALVFPTGFQKYAVPLGMLWHGWVGLCGFVLVLHACHFLVWLWNKFENLKWLRNKFGDHVKTCWDYISG
ncbi:ankyrin repeat-containing protein ITN1-like isoform X1 [Rhododendron vialii]|uniref:ankyrin repeat-containing protein ITN1-like isoform X1 n=1 Tax=Rhododendron vialii TaxID=182163 RepID=UPI00265F6A79|nr:ankyrin repeat-containing protein ITN1-like isoform X1 [Rhododendron vialii]